jgi:hypothetical protein
VWLVHRPEGILDSLSAQFYISVEMAQSQISAFVSDSTREQLEQFADARGVKKAHVVEQALLHHLQALRQVPVDLIIPAQIAVTPASLAQVRKLIRTPRKPTSALRKLMRKR